MDLSISTQSVTLTQILAFVEFYYILTDFTIEWGGIAVMEYCDVFVVKVSIIW